MPIISEVMTQMRASLIWKRLLIQDKRIVTSGEIKELANQLGKNEERSLHYLQEEGYIARILRGFFIVKSIEERERGTYDSSIYEMVALALEDKGVKRWYFGLETALKINNMTHEYFTIDYVLTDSYRTTKVIRILDSKFQFFKRRERYFQDGIIARNGIKYSDPEKTVLDLAYQGYLASRDPGLFLSPIKEYKENIEFEKAHKYLSMYPPSFQEKLAGVL